MLIHRSALNGKHTAKFHVDLFSASMDFVIPQGDNSIIAYEYVEDKEPYLFDVAPFSCGSPHQVREQCLHFRTNNVFIMSKVSVSLLSQCSLGS